MSRPSWGHVSRHCVYCGRVGPRTIVAGGYAHKYCLPKPPKKEKPSAPEPWEDGTPTTVDYDNDCAP